MSLRFNFLAFQNRVMFLLLVFCLSILPGKHQAQNYDTQRNQVLAYNILLNGVVAGIGGAIHKAPGEKTWKVFLKNFGKGSLGGLVSYSAKYQTYYLRYSDNTFMAPANRLFYFLGNSMVMNAALNKKLLSQYHFNMYGMDMVMNFENKETKFLTARVSLATAGAFCGFLIAGHRFDLYKSLEYGIFYFHMNPDITKYAGFATFNCIAIGSNKAGNTFYSVIPHEMIHTYQSYDYFPIANLYTPAMKVKYEKFKLYNILSKYCRLDYEAGFQSLLYITQPTPKYYKNFYEFEAQHFSTRGYIKR